MRRFIYWNLFSKEHENHEKEQGSHDSTKKFPMLLPLAALTTSLTGVGYVIYSVLRQREQQRCNSAWLPTTWSFFLEALQNQHISLVTFIDDLIFFKDTTGHYYKTGMIPGCDTWLFKQIRYLPHVLAIPQKKNWKSWKSSVSTGLLTPFQALPEYVVQPNVRQSLKTFSSNHEILKTACLVTGIILFNSFWSFKFSEPIKSIKYDKQRSAVTFESIVGHTKAKAELRQLVGFLKNPEHVQSLGVRFPRGVLLEGPTGTGKTLLARTLAYEAQVPLFYMPASVFVELYVGQGALRLRQLFSKARQNAPCIIFLDEIDALGASREYLGPQNQEYIQALNQLLTELDGLEKNNYGKSHAILVIAATNRYSVLDSALVRPGRFDKTVTLKLPNQDEREELCRLHSRKMKIDLNTVRFSTVAQLTEGWSGADIECLFNEAALCSLRQDSPRVTSLHLSEVLNALNQRKKRVGFTSQQRPSPFVNQHFSFLNQR